MKNIVRILRLPSVVQSEFYEAAWMFLYTKKIKITTFFVSYLSLRITVAPFCERKLRTLFCVSRNTRMRYFRSSQSVNTHTKCILLLRLTQKSVCSLCSVDNLQNRSGDTERHRHTCKLTGGQIRWLSLECNPCWGGVGENLTCKLRFWCTLTTK